MECNYCSGKCCRSGYQKNGLQRFYCVSCKRYQQISYRYKGCLATTNHQIKRLVCEGVGIRGIARVLSIGRQTVLNKVKGMAEAIKRPAVKMDVISIEVDELWTYIGRKNNEYWVAYAIDRKTRKVVDFVVGKRKKATLKKMIRR